MKASGLTRLNDLGDLFALRRRSTDSHGGSLGGGDDVGGDDVSQRTHGAMHVRVLHAHWDEVLGCVVRHVGYAVFDHELSVTCVLSAPIGIGAAEETALVEDINLVTDTTYDPVAAADDAPGAQVLGNYLGAFDLRKSALLPNLFNAQPVLPVRVELVSSVEELPDDDDDAATSATSATSSLSSSPPPSPSPSPQRVKFAVATPATPATRPVARRRSTYRLIFPMTKLDAKAMYKFRPGGADSGFHPVPLFVYSPDERRYEVLRRACREGDVESVKLVLTQGSSHGVDDVLVNHRNEHDGVTALMEAALHGSKDICELLLNYNAHVGYVSKVTSMPTNVPAGCTEVPPSSTTESGEPEYTLAPSGRWGWIHGCALATRLEPDETYYFEIQVRGEHRVILGWAHNVGDTRVPPFRHKASLAATFYAHKHGAVLLNGETQTYGTFAEEVSPWLEGGLLNRIGAAINMATREVRFFVNDAEFHLHAHDDKVVLPTIEELREQGIESGGLLPVVYFDPKRSEGNIVYNSRSAVKMGMTALMNAAWNGHTDVVALLLQHNAQPYGRNSMGDTAIALAAQRGHLDVVKQLLASNEDLIFTSAGGHRPKTMPAGYSPIPPLPANADPHELFEEISESPTTNVYTHHLTVCHVKMFPTVCPVGVALKSGKYYYEVELLTKGLMQVGWASCDLKPDGDVNGVGDMPGSYSFDGLRRVVFVNGVVSQADHCDMRWRERDRVGTAIDLDRGEVRFYLNGRQVHQASIGAVPACGVRPAISLSAYRARYGNAAVFIFDEDKFETATSSTALQAAAAAGNVDIVKHLLGAKADPNIRSRMKESALMLACRNGHAEVARLLLQSGADPTLHNTKGFSALTLATQGQHVECVDVLVREGNVNVNIERDLNPTRQDSSAESRMDSDHACTVDAIEYHIAEGELHLSCTWEFDQQRMEAAYQFRQPIESYAEFLQAMCIESSLYRPGMIARRAAPFRVDFPHGTDGGSLSLVLVFAFRDLKSNTFYKFRFGLTSAADERADAHLADEDSDADEPLTRSPSRLAQKSKPTYNAAPLFIFAPPPHFDTALQIAVSRGLDDMVSHLLSYNASTEVTDIRRRTPLHVAAYRGYANIVRALLDAGADAQAADQYLGTPLHSAAKAGRPECLRAILDAGAATDALDENGWSALMLASKHGHAAVVELLLGANADTEVSAAGWNARNLAAKHEHSQVLRLLNRGTYRSRFRPMEVISSTSLGTARLVKAAQVTVNSNDPHSVVTLKFLDSKEEYDARVQSMRNMAAPPPDGADDQPESHLLKLLYAFEPMTAEEAAEDAGDDQELQAYNLRWCIVLEHGDMSLYDWILAHRVDKDENSEELGSSGVTSAIPDAGKIIHDVAAALSEMHERHWVRNDLSPKNIYRFRGPARHPNDPPSYVWKFISHKPTSRGGKPLTSVVLNELDVAYVAPELQPVLLRHRAGVNDDSEGKFVASMAADVFALGTVAYELLTHAPLYVSRHARGRRMTMRFDPTRLVLDALSSQVSGSYAERFITDVLVSDPMKRPSISDVIELPYVKLAGNSTQLIIHSLRQLREALGQFGERTHTVPHMIYWWNLRFYLEQYFGEVLNNSRDEVTRNDKLVEPLTAVAKKLREAVVMWQDLVRQGTIMGFNGLIKHEGKLQELELGIYHSFESFWRCYRPNAQLATTDVDEDETEDSSGTAGLKDSNPLFWYRYFGLFKPEVPRDQFISALQLHLQLERLKGSNMPFFKEVISNVLDADDDGMVTRTEWIHFLDSYGPLSDCYDKAKAASVPYFATREANADGNDEDEAKRDDADGDEPHVVDTVHRAGWMSSTFVKDEKKVLSLIKPEFHFVVMPSKGVNRGKQPFQFCFQRPASSTEMTEERHASVLGSSFSKHLERIAIQQDVVEHAVDSPFDRTFVAIAARGHATDRQRVYKLAGQSKPYSSVFDLVRAKCDELNWSDVVARLDRSANLWAEANELHERHIESQPHQDASSDTNRVRQLRAYFVPHLVQVDYPPIVPYSTQPLRRLLPPVKLGYNQLPEPIEFYQPARLHAIGRRVSNPSELGVVADNLTLVAVSDMYIVADKWYWEIELNSTTDSKYVGWATSTFIPYSMECGFSRNSVGFDPASGSVMFDSRVVETCERRPTCVPGSIIGCALDLTNPFEPRFEFSVDGHTVVSWARDVAPPQEEERWLPAVTLTEGSDLTLRPRGPNRTALKRLRSFIRSPLREAHLTSSSAKYLAEQRKHRRKLVHDYRSRAGLSLAHEIVLRALHDVEWLQLIRLLAEEEADLKQLSGDGESPLYLALKAGASYNSPHTLAVFNALLDVTFSDEPSVHDIASRRASSSKSMVLARRQALAEVLRLAVQQAHLPTIRSLLLTPDHLADVQHVLRDPKRARIGPDNLVHTLIEVFETRTAELGSRGESSEVVRDEKQRISEELMEIFDTIYYHVFATIEEQHNMDKERERHRRRRESVRRARTQHTSWGEDMLSFTRERDDSYVALPMEDSDRAQHRDEVAPLDEDDVEHLMPLRRRTIQLQHGHVLAKLMSFGARFQALGEFSIAVKAYEEALNIDPDSKAAARERNNALERIFSPVTPFVDDSALHHQHLEPEVDPAMRDEDEDEVKSQSDDEDSDDSDGSGGDSGGGMNIRVNVPARDVGSDMDARSRSPSVVPDNDDSGLYLEFGRLLEFVGEFRYALQVFNRGYYRCPNSRELPAALAEAHARRRFLEARRPRPTPQAGDKPECEIYPILHAASTGFKSMILRLVELGARHDVVDDEQGSLMHRVVSAHTKWSMPWLKEIFYVLGKMQLPVHINGRDRNNASPLYRLLLSIANADAQELQKLKNMVLYLMLEEGAKVESLHGTPSAEKAVELLAPIVVERMRLHPIHRWNLIAHAVYIGDVGLARMILEPFGSVQRHILPYMMNPRSRVRARKTGAVQEDVRGLHTEYPSVLHLAIATRFKSSAIVNMLLDFNMPQNETSAYLAPTRSRTMHKTMGETSRQRRHSISMMTKLKDEQFVEMDINCVDGEGRTALHLVALLEESTSFSTATAARLIGQKMNVIVRDDDGLTVLHYACINGHLDIVDLLLAQHSNPEMMTGLDLPDDDPFDDAGDAGDHARRQFPLHLAAKRGHWQIVSSLIKHKAEVNVLDSKGNSPLAVAMLRRMHYLQQLNSSEFASPEQLDQDDVSELSVALDMEDDDEESELGHPHRNDDHLEYPMDDDHDAIAMQRVGKSKSTPQSSSRSRSKDGLHGLAKASSTSSLRIGATAQASQHRSVSRGSDGKAGIVALDRLPTMLRRERKREHAAEMEQNLSETIDILLHSGADVQVAIDSPSVEDLEELMPVEAQWVRIQTEVAGVEDKLRTVMSSPITDTKQRGQERVYEQHVKQVFADKANQIVINHMYHKLVRRKHFIKLFRYFVFLVLLTYLGIQEATRDEKSAFFLNRALEQTLVEDEIPYNISQIKRTYKDIDSAAEYFMWLRGPLLDVMYPSEQPNYWNNATQVNRGRAFVQQSRMIGRPRLRQIRSSERDCDLLGGFDDLTRVCLESPSLGQDRQAFGPSAQYEWQSEDELEGTWTWGLAGWYDGSGYVQVLPELDGNANGRAEALSLIDELERNTWIDSKTRALFVEFSAFNGNENFFVVATVLMETPPVGGFVPSWEFNVAKVKRLTSLDDYSILVVEIVVMLMVLRHVLGQVRSMANVGCNFFSSVYHTFDFGLTVLYVTLIVMHVTLLTWENDVDFFADDRFVPLHRNARWVDIEGDIFSLAVFFSWLKLLHYLSVFRKLSRLVVIVQFMVRELASFAFLLLVVLCAFASGEQLAYGYRYPQTRTWVYTFLTRISSIFGDDPLQGQKPRVLGAFYSISFAIIVTLLLLNLLIAILTSAYEEARAASGDAFWTERLFYDVTMYPRPLPGSKQVDELFEKFFTAVETVWRAFERFCRMSCKCGQPTKPKYNLLEEEQAKQGKKKRRLHSGYASSTRSRVTG